MRRPKDGGRKESIKQEVQGVVFESVVNALRSYGLDDARDILTRQPEQWAVGQFAVAAGSAAGVQYSGSVATPQVLDTYELLDPRIWQIPGASATSMPHIIVLGLLHRVSLGSNVIGTTLLSMAEMLAGMATRWTPAGQGVPGMAAITEGFRAGPFGAFRESLADYAIGGHTDNERAAFVLRFPWWIDTQVDRLEFVYGGGSSGNTPPTTPVETGVQLSLIGAVIGRGLVRDRPAWDSCVPYARPVMPEVATAVQGVR